MPIFQGDPAMLAPKAGAMKKRISNIQKPRRIARREAIAFLDQQKGGDITERKAAERGSAAQSWAKRRRPLAELRGKVKLAPGYDYKAGRRG
jgi:hypothetical protein